MGKNKLHLKRAQALAKKETLALRESIIQQLKTTALKPEQQNKLHSFQENNSVQMQKSRIDYKTENKIALTDFELKKTSKHQALIEIDQAENILNRTFEEEIEEEEIITEPEEPQPIVVVDEGKSTRVPLSVIQHPELEEPSENDFTRVSDYPEKAIQNNEYLLQFPQLPKPLPIEELKVDFQHIIANNDIFVISTSTGTGKSTQIPKYLLEYGYGHNRFGYKQNIIITEPRRIAAASCCDRVRQEIGSQFEDYVGYAVRGENLNPGAKVLFVTEGVLMQQLQTDFMLKNISVIVLDEAHERSQSMDIIIALLSRLVALRRKQFEEQFNTCLQKQMSPEQMEQTITTYPLKVILMSATLQNEDYFKNKKLFKQKPPVLELNQQMFPVAVHYESVQENDFLMKTVQKIQFVHENFGSGSILVFLSGQGEIRECISQLESYFNEPAKLSGPAIIQDEVEDELINQIVGETETVQPNIEEPQVYTEDQLHTVFIPNQFTQEQLDELKREYDEVETKKDKPEFVKKVYTPKILPLHGQLTIEEQQLIFKPIGENERLIIIATNVAESSLTIPAVKYVIDACRQKQKVQTNTGCRLAVQLCAESNLIQRTGRAGRVCVGHCFRLITPGQMISLDQQQKCEMLRLPVESVILNLLELGVRDIEHFPFPTHPGVDRLMLALENLYGLNCIVREGDFPKLTQFGSQVAKMPLDIKQSVIFAQGLDSQHILYFGMMAATYSVENLFQFGQEFTYPIKTKHGDFIDRLFTFGAYITFDSKKRKSFCQQNGLRQDAFNEMEKVLQTLARKYQIEDKPGKPSQQAITELKQAVMQTCIKNIGFLVDQKYQIAPINLFDFEKNLDETLRKNHILDDAKINKFSYYYKANLQPKCIIYFSTDVLITKIEDNQVASVFMNDIQEIKQEDLLNLAEYSPFITTSAPLQSRYSNNLQAKVTCYYDNLHQRTHIGETWVSYPGRTFANDNPSITPLEYARAFSVSLLKGDIIKPLQQFSSQVQNSIKINFNKGLISKNTAIDELSNFFIQKGVRSVKDIKNGVREQIHKFKDLIGKCYMTGFELVWNEVVKGM
ncbi:ATP-dependent_RNA helicase [Hexamita inflata]|uniref:ATP-dependent RNA helicase n=1 Tax=Hexamita inflata TaxID=28002 RepID=A0AA86Q342_9EUKA|nr:ATP-dependent RNA helicase [Hexamita inflata]